MSAEQINDLELTIEDFEHLTRQIDNVIALCANKVDEGMAIWSERVDYCPMTVTIVFACNLWNISVHGKITTYAQAITTNCPDAWAEVDRQLIRGFYGETS